MQGLVVKFIGWPRYSCEMWPNKLHFLPWSPLVVHILHPSVLQYLNLIGQKVANITIWTFLPTFLCMFVDNIFAFNPILIAKNSISRKTFILSLTVRTLVWWLEYSPMAQETWVQPQVESCQRLKKWYLMPPCLTQQYKVWIKGKVEQSRERSSTLPYTLV